MTIREFANRVADAARYELGETGREHDFEMTVGRIEQVMQQGRQRTNTPSEFSKWCKSVENAAMHMAQDGEDPRGEQLKTLSEMYYAR